MDTAEYYLKVKADSKIRKITEEESQIKYNREHYACCQQLKTESHSRICVNADEHLGFKNRFVQHYPAFFTAEDDDYFVLNFNTQDELLACEFIIRWEKDSDERKFHRYSLSDNHLMVEYENGKEWWCIGRLKTIDGLNLPKWEIVK